MSNRFVPNLKSVLWSIVLLVIVPGCGKSDGYSGDRGDVSGQITLDGEAVPEGCRVLFLSLKAGYTAAGVTDADGKYSLSCSKGKKIPAVEYGVQIAAPPEPADAAEEDKKPPGVVGKEAMAQLEQAAEEKAVIPSKYSLAATSKLKFKVEKGSNTADFPLVKKKK